MAQIYCFQEYPLPSTAGLSYPLLKVVSQALVVARMVTFDQRNIFCRAFVVGGVVPEVECFSMGIVEV